MEKFGIGKFCGNCKHWSFNVSTEKAWGRCLSLHANRVRRLSMMHPPDFLKSKEEIIEYNKSLQSHVEMWFEEMSLACGYWCEDSD